MTSIGQTFAKAQPLELCLIAAAREFGQSLSLAALRAQRTGLDTELTVEGMVDLAERLGFVVGLGELPLERLDADLFPAILLSRSGRAILATGRRQDQLSILDPCISTSDAGLVPINDLKAAYDGRVIFLRRRDNGVDASSTAAQTGHWFWSTLFESKWSYTQVLLAAAISNVLGLATSIFIMVVYDRVLPNEAVDSLIALTFGVGVALLFDFIIRSLRAGFIDRAGQKADLMMGRRIFEQVVDIQMRAKRGSTGAIANTMREFETLRDFITSATLVGVVDLPFIALFIFVISIVGGPLALVPAIAVPLVLIIGVAVQPILSRMAERSHSEGQNKQSVLVETISGLETIKTIGASAVMRQRWDRALAHQSDYSSRSRAVSQFALNATAFAQQAAQVMIVFYGVFLITAGQVSMGALIACVILTGRTLAPLAQLAQTMTRFSQAKASYRSINALMQQPVEHMPDRNWLSRPRLSGKIEFRDVTFRYPDQKTLSLRNVSFHIEAGEKVAILGKVGSGKSTIGRLLTGLYAADEGQVLIDDTDVMHIAPHDLRNNIGTLLQDVWLFSGTVRQNIAVGTSRASDEAILEASRQAGVHDFVSRHPLGYDLTIAERGAGLSGGQRQSIALARALVGQKPILFLDEPTSTMDVQSEKVLISRLLDVATDRTLVLVTHRTAMLEAVDRVLVLEDGQIVFDGTKDALTRYRMRKKEGPVVVSNAG